MEDTLEKLAVDFCKEFLKIYDSKHNNPKDIGLHGAEENTLFQLKNKMLSYMEQQNIPVNIGLNQKGYTINVGYFLKN